MRVGFPGRRGLSGQAGPRRWRRAGGRPSPRGDGAPRWPPGERISDVRFRNPVYPGDETLIEVKKKEAMGGFTMMSGNVKKADGTRVLTVEFSVAWKTPEGQQTAS